MPHSRLTIHLPPSADAVAPLLDRLEAYAEANDLPPLAAHRLTVVCEELAANVAMHGSKGSDGATFFEIVVEFRDGRLHLSIEDDGEPFDPLAKDAPDTGLDLEDREIGGLGIHLVRRMVTAIAYARQGGRNRLDAVLEATV